MKKIVKLMAVVLSVAMVCFAFVSCGEKDTEKTEKSEYDAEVNKAIEKIKELWDEKVFHDAFSDEKTIKMVNTQVVIIKDNPTFEAEEDKNAYNKYLNDVKMIIQFEILSNYFAKEGNESGYMQNAKYLDEVIVYKNGEYEVTSGIFRAIGAETFDYDFDVYIEKVVDLGSSYDQTINL